MDRLSFNLHHAHSDINEATTWLSHEGHLQPTLIRFLTSILSNWYPFTHSHVKFNLYPATSSLLCDLSLNLTVACTHTGRDRQEGSKAGRQRGRIVWINSERFHASVSLMTRLFFYLLFLFYFFFAFFLFKSPALIGQWEFQSSKRKRKSKKKKKMRKCKKVKNSKTEAHWEKKSVDCDLDRPKIWSIEQIFSSSPLLFILNIAVSTFSSRYLQSEVQSTTNSQ